jgi:CHASE3 domain sensor protein
MSFTPVQKLSIGTGAALGLLALVGLVSYLSITQLIGGARAVAGTNANIARLDRVISRTVDAENSQRGYVTTGDERYLEPINSAQSDVEFALDTLHAATEDNPEQRRNFDKLSPLVANRFREIRAAVALRQRLGLDTVVTLLRTQRQMRDGAGILANQMRDQELRVLGERTRVMTDRGSTALNFILASSLIALGLAFIALQPLRPSVARRLTQRLSQVMLPPIPELQLTISEEARHAGDRLVRLQQVIHALNGRGMSGLDVATALLTRGAPPLVASVGVVVRREAAGQYVVVRSLGDVVTHLGAGAVVPSNLAGPMIAAEESQEPVVVESRADRARRFPTLGRFSESGTSDGAFVAVPLVAHGAAHGVLMLAFADNRLFSDDERAYLATLGRIGGQSLSSSVV